MQDAGSMITTARLNDLVNSISEARRSLQNWQDQKTEALIRLDAFTYDVQKIEDDRLRIVERHEALLRESETNYGIYQKQIGELSDQLQILKFELEGLKNQTTGKDLEIESLKKELENQERIKEQMIEQHSRRMTEQANEAEKRHREALQSEKRIQESLSGELAEMTLRKSEAISKVERLERDLSHIRSHMLGVLQGDGVVPSRAPLDTQNIQKIVGADSEVATVDDYLKRLGY